MEGKKRTKRRGTRTVFTTEQVTSRFKCIYLSFKSLFQANVVLNNLYKRSTMDLLDEILTFFQLFVLNEFFSRCTVPIISEKKEMAKNLGLTYQNVDVS